MARGNFVEIQSPMVTAPARISAEHVIRHREVDRSSPEGPGFNFLDADLNEALRKIQDRTEQSAKRHCATDGRVPPGRLSCKVEASPARPKRAV